jgi:hypothetical protein
MELRFELFVEVDPKAEGPLIAAARKFDAEYLGEPDEPYNLAKALAVVLNQDGFNTLREVIGKTSDRNALWFGWWIDVDKASRDNES